MPFTEAGLGFQLQLALGTMFQGISQVNCKSPFLPLKLHAQDGQPMVLQSALRSVDGTPAPFPPREGVALENSWVGGGSEPVRLEAHVSPWRPGLLLTGVSKCHDLPPRTLLELCGPLHSLLSSRHAGFSTGPFPSCAQYSRPCTFPNPKLCTPAIVCLVLCEGLLHDKVLRADLHQLREAEDLHHSR